MFNNNTNTSMSLERLDQHFEEHDLSAQARELMRRIQNYRQSC